MKDNLENKLPREPKNIRELVSLYSNCGIPPSQIYRDINQIRESHKNSSVSFDMLKSHLKRKYPFVR